MTHPRIVAIVNQKGGVGKTTTALNLGAALADDGMRVLIVDLDPQGNASTGLGFDPDRRGWTTGDLIFDGAPLSDCAVPTDVPNLSLVPGTADLASADMELIASDDRGTRLRDALRDAVAYDYVLIDCPPSLSLLTVNALVAATSVLVPLQSEFFALEGLSQLMLTIRQVRAGPNPDLRIDGVAMTMFDGRNNLARQVERDARDTLGDLVFRTVVPRNVRISEAPSYALPVTHYDPASKGSAAYVSLARELMARTRPAEAAHV
ncbi:MAG: ParA family protein [Paracoccaceae bacterium]